MITRGQRYALGARQRGMNLLEILVASCLVALGLLGMAGMQMKSMKVTHNSYQMQQAAQLAHELLERMRANRVAGLAGNYQINTNAVDFCTADAVGTCLAGTVCTPSQLAADDLLRVMCGYGAGSGIRGVLLDGRMAVSCPTANDCNQGVRLTLQWQERSPSQGAGDDTEPFSLTLNTAL